MFLIYSLKVPFIIVDSINSSYILYGECFISGLIEVRENFSNIDKYLLLS